MLILLTTALRGIQSNTIILNLKSFAVVRSVFLLIRYKKKMHLAPFEAIKHNTCI